MSSTFPEASLAFPACSYIRSRMLLELRVAATPLINVQVLEQFQATDPDSDQFNLRLIEITAVAIHEISVTLFGDKNKYHDEDEIHRVTMWQTPPTVINSDGRQEVLPHPPPKLILFYHYRYLNHENYPAGLADAAGYWAEVRIHIGFHFSFVQASTLACQCLGLGGGGVGSQYLLGPKFSDRPTLLTSNNSGSDIRWRCPF